MAGMGEEAKLSVLVAEGGEGENGGNGGSAAPCGGGVGIGKR